MVNAIYAPPGYPGVKPNGLIFGGSSNGEGCRLDRNINTTHERGSSLAKVKTSRVERIKEDLLQYLEDAGIYGEYFIDIVDEYCRLWEVKEMLWDDIKIRGVTSEWQNSETSKGVKKNESVKEHRDTLEAMSKRLNQLGIDPKTMNELGGADADDFFED